MAPFDPTLGLRWLVRARRALLVAQVLVMALAELGTTLHLHSPQLVAVLLAGVAIDAIEAAVIRRGPPAWALVAHAFVDLVLVTAIVWLAGGIQNPLVSAYLVYLALFAILLPTRVAWTLAVSAMILQALVVLVPGLPNEELPLGHVLGHVVTFDLAAIAITGLVSEVSAALSARDAIVHEAERRQATTERLAALGTLAAGVAHELGTPLGAMTLHAEEILREAPRAQGGARAILRQVERCRELLDRLRGRDSDATSVCVPDVTLWVSEWRRAVPEVAVEIESAAPCPAVLGAEESWRAAVWTALDNAHRAGARRVSIAWNEEGDSIEVSVDDDGSGIGDDDARRAGEPFRTSWGGTGLALFVSRTFAASVGGDVVLEAGPGGGARTRIRMRRAS